jgi:hypothetical protein
VLRARGYGSFPVRILTLILTVASWIIWNNWFIDLILYHGWRLLFAFYDCLWVKHLICFWLRNFPLVASYFRSFFEVNIIIFFILLLLPCLTVKTLAGDDFSIHIQLARSTNIFSLWVLMWAHSLVGWHVLDPACRLRLAYSGHCSDAFQSASLFSFVSLLIWNLVGTIWGVTVRYEASGLESSLCRL